MRDITIVITILAALGGVLFAVAARVSAALVRSRAHRLPTRIALRMEEEWLGELNAIASRPGVVQPQAVSKEFVRGLIEESLEERSRSILQTVMSRTSLLTIIRSFPELKIGRETWSMDRMIVELRKDITVEFSPSWGGQFLVVDPANMGTPVVPNRLAIAGIGAFAGFVLGGMAVVGLGRRQRRALA